MEQRPKMDAFRQSTFELIALLLALATLQCVIPRAIAECDSAQVNKQCFADFGDFALFFHQLEKLIALCSNVDNIPSCLIDQGCSSTGSLYGRFVFAIADGLTYLCGDAKQYFDATNQCMGTTAAHFTINKCQIAFAVNQTNKCPALNDFIKCLRIVVLDSCGADIDRVYATFLRKIMPSAGEKENCTIDQSVLQLNSITEEQTTSSHVFPSSEQKLTLSWVFSGNEQKSTPWVFPWSSQKTTPSWVFPRSLQKTTTQWVVHWDFNDLRTTKSWVMKNDPWWNSADRKNFSLPLLLVSFFIGMVVCLNKNI
jgi:hypothetical protein